MLREDDQQIPSTNSKPFVIRHNGVTDLHALKGMRGTWKNNHLHFQSKYLTFVAKPTTETKEIFLYGETHQVQVYQATTTRQRIPPMFTTRKPYRHIHDTLVRKMLLDIVSTRIPRTVKEIRKHLERRSHQGQVAFSQTDKYLSQQLKWLENHKCIRSKKASHKRKSSSTWIKTNADMDFHIPSDMYMAYHACWHHVARLRNLGLTLDGLIGTVREEERALNEALDKCRARTNDMTDIKRLACALRSAPWWNPEGTPGVFEEVWEQDFKVMNLQSVSTPIPTRAKNLLRAYLKYPFHGEINVGQPFLLYKSIKNLEKPWKPGSCVHDGKELRIIQSITHTHAMLCSIQSHRRQFKTPTPISKLTPAWRITLKYVKKPTLTDATACFISNTNPKPLLCQWKEGDNNIYTLEIQLLRNR